MGQRWAFILNNATDFLLFLSFLFIPTYIIASIYTEFRNVLSCLWYAINQSINQSINFCEFSARWVNEYRLLKKEMVKCYTKILLESFLAYEQTLSSYPLIMLGRAYAIVERHFHGSQTQCSLRISLSCRSRTLNSWHSRIPDYRILLNLVSIYIHNPQNRGGPNAILWEMDPWEWREHCIWFGIENMCSMALFFSNCLI